MPRPNRHRCALLATLPCALCLTVVPEPVWRGRAAAHAARVHALLAPGFGAMPGLPRDARPTELRPLDRRNPVFNFLSDYYHVKGLKGCRQLARWSASLPAGGGVLLEGATADDLGDGVLHLRGATVLEGGVAYDAVAHCAGQSAAPYVWHADVLAATEANEPVLHCYGLHEWAMQYHPEGSAAPPSAQYQRDSGMALRVSQRELNDAVERRGVSCTHVDALRFFAPAAAPLNHHGATLLREQQTELEQPACVHAHMDLLKMAMRLSPWLGSELLADCLELALAARTLDVAASPYDASAWEIEPVPIETAAGRAEYRRRQTELMAAAAPIRAELRKAYAQFLGVVFGRERVAAAAASPDAERFASATPGGPPWRRSLLGGPGAHG